MAPDTHCRGLRGSRLLGALPSNAVPPQAAPWKETEAANPPPGLRTPRASREAEAPGSVSGPLADLLPSEGPPSESYGEPTGGRAVCPTPDPPGWIARDPPLQPGRPQAGVTRAVHERTLSSRDGYPPRDLVCAILEHRAQRPTPRGTRMVENWRGLSGTMQAPPDPPRPPHLSRGPRRRIPADAIGGRAAANQQARAARSRCGAAPRYR